VPMDRCVARFSPLLTERTTQARAAAVLVIRVRSEWSRGSSIDIADVQSKGLVTVADRDSADKAKADVERVEAE
jgi:hypothetical protein